MINIIQAVKELLTIKRAITEIRSAPKSGVLTTEFWSLFLTQAAAIYMGAVSLIPATWALGVGVGLSLIWLGVRWLLKSHHLSLSSVQGIPDLDVDALVGALVKKFPNLAVESDQITAVAKDVVTEIKADPVPAANPS